MGPDGGRPGPRRTCIGCRRTAHPDELVRVVRTPDGGLAVGRHRPGRGAWVDPDPDCLALARRRRAWGRALRGSVADADIDAVEVEVTAAAGTLEGRSGAPGAPASPPTPAT